MGNVFVGGQTARVLANAAPVRNAASSSVAQTTARAPHRVPYPYVRRLRWRDGSSTTPVAMDVKATREAVARRNNGDMLEREEDRKWHMAESKERNQTMKVMSYNILSELFVRSHTKHGVSQTCLAFSTYRLPLIQRELIQYDADIIALQECDQKAFKLFMKNLEGLGYEGVFEKKDNESERIDGCSLFWKSDRFRLLATHQVSFSKLSAAHENAMQFSDEECSYHPMYWFWKHMKAKDNIAQCIFLRVLDCPNQSVLCVGNAHLFWDPFDPHIKAMQASLLVTEMERLCAERTDDPAVLLCGDFNSQPSVDLDWKGLEARSPRGRPAQSQPTTMLFPNAKSGVYELLCDGKLSLEHPHHPARFVTTAGMKQDESETQVVPEDGCIGPIQTKLQLESSYKTILQSEPPFTNYANGFVGTLDYIWFEPHRMRALATLEVPNKKLIQKFGQACPNAKFPSDHLPLMTVFDLSRNKVQRDAAL